MLSNEARGRCDHDDLTLIFDVVCETGCVLKFEEGAMPRTYDSEFRRRVVELVRSGRSVAAVCAELGLAEATVYRWKAQDLIDRGENPGGAPLSVASSPQPIGVSGSCRPSLS